MVTRPKRLELPEGIPLFLGQPWPDLTSVCKHGATRGAPCNITDAGAAPLSPRLSFLGKSTADLDARVALLADFLLRCQIRKSPRSSLAHKLRLPRSLYAGLPKIKRWAEDFLAYNSGSAARQW